ncbi:hypothetical protein ACL2XO_04965 [Sodalis sp. RH15]|uniref:hypothetical protein n=1 Tax=Sodalis sp. RH15 TaxID=3394330 RepID=UPI0039B45ABA
MIREKELSEAFIHAVCVGVKGERIRTADLIEQARARGIHLTPEEANTYLARVAKGMRLIAEGRHNLNTYLKIG